MNYVQLLTKTPIVFLVFNRPDTTIRVFEGIRRARPAKLFVVADGPRADRPGEAEKCRVVRAIIDTVDWPCEVLKNFSDVNLGCKRRVSGGLNWVFEQVEEAIILEDDCLPHPTFFRFCKELLDKYRDDERVMHISGDNFQFERVRGDGSYYFSRYNHIWGWATWKRAWAHYDVKMKMWPKFLKQQQIANVFENRSIQRYWLKCFQAVYEGKIDTWDYQWLYAIWSQNGLTVLPNVNLISNIGFGEDATHTTGKNDKSANMKTGSMFEIVHPSFVMVNKEADLFTFKTHFQRTFFARARGKTKNIFRRIVKNIFKK